MAAGIGTQQALGAALAMGTLGVLSGTFVIVFVASLKGGAALTTAVRRAAA